ncbi:MAG: putative zinc finger motif, C2HC5-type-domain-containing protein [Linnemannia elongata]|nr:MAG: putative zinc finger motif, C2HC5-type-domain-containing protein [Linnemannia elongata]
MSNRAKKQAKKTAAEPLSELEKAIRAIDLATESVNAAKERKPCYCLATKHKLNVFAPNCLSCGKIICALEGPGPCTYCGQQVVSIDQQQAMILELKREKAALAKLQQQATAKRRVKATAVSTAGYASKLGGGMSSATGAAGGWVGLDGSDSAPAMTEEEELEEAKKASLAQAHKEKLLEFDRTSAKRSHVIDQATDFVLPGDRPNLWLTEEERQAQADKARQNLEKVTTAASGYQRAKVMTIDVVNRRVVVEASANQFVQEEEDDAVPEPVSMFDQSKSTSISGGDRHGGRGGAFALNPLLRLGENPTFISKKTAKDSKDKVLKVKAEQKPKLKISKLQYDDGGHAAVMQDAEFSFSSGGDSQSVLASIVEPSCG